MARLATLVCVALCTFVVGVTVAWVLQSQPRSASREQSRTSVLSLAAKPNQVQAPGSEGNEDDDPINLDSVYIKGNKLTYAGYEVERFFDERKRQSFVTIKRESNVLAVLRDGSFIEETSQIGLFPFLGDETKQLVIMQYTGGAHCCWIYRIYDLVPKFRKLFDGGDYGLDSIGYELIPEDIDRDGRYEFVQAVMAFDYFHMSHASSFFPSALFAYDEKKGKYVPANRKFSSYLMQNSEKHVRSLEALRGTVDPENGVGREEYLSAVLKVMLTYVYAGEEKQGWEFFEREYQLRDKTEIRQDIRTTLNAERVYRSIYRR